MIAVEPRSGCPIINTEIMNRRINGFKKLLKELISDILLTEYPEIYKKWKDGKDEAFPNGESYKIVSDRLFEFLKSVESDNCLIMTHQGVIRSFIGRSLNIALNRWHLLQIPHLEPIYYFNLNDDYYIDIDRSLFHTIFKEYIKY